MSDEAWAFWFRFFGACLLSLAIYYGVEAFGHWIAWWAAGLIGFAVVYGGWLILMGDDWFS